MIAQMFEDAWYILFPKPSKKYSRDRLGRFTFKLTTIWIGEGLPLPKKARFENESKVVFYE